MKINGIKMTPAEQRQGRLMRAPDGHPDPTPMGPANDAATQPSNFGPSANTPADSNNAGQTFDPASFWDGPASSGSSASSEESARGSQAESGTQDGGTSGGFAEQLTERLNGLTFGEAVMDREIAEQISEGNFDGFQARINALGQQIVREALAVNVQILREFTPQLLAQAREETQQTFTSRDNEQSLVQHFPAAKNPAMARTIQPIYAQALKNTGGNREQAIAQTKEMLRFMAGESAESLNLEIAPKGTGSRSFLNSTTNWLDELTGRNEGN